MSRRTPWMLAALLTGVLSMACGGGGGGGGGGGPTTPPPPGITFTPSQAATDDSVFLQQSAETTPSRLFLQVRVNSVADFYGVAFDLLYPSQALAFAKATKGGFLKGSTSLQAEARVPGRLIVGLTNLGADDAESGSGILMTLEFTAAGNGSGQMSFDNEQAFRPGSLPQTVTFIGGSVSVQN